MRWEPTPRDQVQPVAEGPVGQYITHRPVGPDGIFSTCDSDQPMADGPVGRYITRSPVGLLSTCDSDRPVADGPVGQSFILGPVGPRRMFSQCKPNQPVAVGPVGQSFTTSPVGSTVIPDPVEKMGSPIQTDEDILYNDVTICENENSSVNSGTDGGNSDIGVLADFQMMMKIAPQSGIRKITADAGGGLELIRTFPVMKSRICATDRSRSRRRHGPGGILMVPVMNIVKTFPGTIIQIWSTNWLGRR